MSTAGPPHRVQSAVVEYGYPQGHLGHLSSEEEEAFKNFKLLCADKGFYAPGNGEDEIATHDDPTLLRFLRARRFIVQDAFIQFKDTEEWRKANQLDQLYETIDLEHYEETRRLYPQWTGRRDRRGIPVYVFEVKHLNAKTMSAYEKSAINTKTKAQTDGKTSPKLLRLFALYENLTRFVMPLSTALTDREHPHTPITQSNNIVDISGVGLKQFWNLRGHMQDASTLATAHYPETLDRIFIIGAPAFFPTVWGWIKKWFDPITTSKIFILSQADMKATLESFIDPANIPAKYGGKLEFQFGDMPVLDPAFEKVLKWEGTNNNFPRGPMYWEDKKGRKVGDGEEIDLIAVGSVNEKERKEKVCHVTKTFPEKSEPAKDDATGYKGLFSESKTDLLRIPTAAPSEISTPVNEFPPRLPVSAEKSGEKSEVQEGELVPASRPELVKFHTAQEGLESLTLDNKENASTPTAVGGADANGPHATRTANLLDPNASTGGKDGEVELEHATADKEKAEILNGKTNGSSKEGLNGNGNTKAEKEGSVKKGLLGRVKGTVGL